MKKKRIIPCLDLNNGRVVKGVHFVSLRDAGDPVEAAQAYCNQQADELAMLDITATYEGRETITEIITAVAAKISIPITIGGGIRSIADFERMFAAGASKVSVNSAAIENPRLIRDAAKAFGSGRVIVAIDAKSEAGRNSVYINGGRVDTGKDAVEWAKEAQALGAGEILLTSMDRDGTKQGFDLDLTQAVSGAVNIPVIASGGAGELAHFYDALTIGKADAVLAASLFHFNEITVGGLKSYLAERGIPVNLAN